MPHRIGVLAHELADAITQAPTLEAEDALEVGRLVAKLELLTGGPVTFTRAPQDGRMTAAAHRKRIRLEKRPMRRAERVLDGPDGHRVVFNFHTFTVTEEVPGEEPFTRTCKDRKELWAQLREVKAHFRKAQVQSGAKAVNF